LYKQILTSSKLILVSLLKFNFQYLPLLSEEVNPRHVDFAKDEEPTKDLGSVIERFKPNVLIGTSTVGGAFTEQIVRAMSDCNEKPIIFALSNPTANAECTAEQAYKWTNVSFL
jgi:malate dehydrogenase (oxaloacetate-decarboxylating)(NADP+)